MPSYPNLQKKHRLRTNIIGAYKTFLAYILSNRDL